MSAHYVEAPGHGSGRVNDRTAHENGWPDIPYEAWRETCSALHLYTQIIGKYRLARTPWEPAHPQAHRGAFGWIKTVAGQDKTRFRGTARVGFAFTFAAADYNLVRLPKLLAQAPT